MFRNSSKINSFCQERFYDYTAHRVDSLKQEIYSQTKEYILSIDENEYVNFLTKKYSLEPLVVETSKMTVSEPQKFRQRVRGDFHNEEYEIDAYRFTAFIPFQGSGELFSLAPSSRALISYPISFNVNTGLVGFDFSITKRDKAAYDGAINSALRGAFTNVNNANAEVITHNNQIAGAARNFFNARKKDLHDENRFFEEINVKVNNDTNTIFTVPTVTKKIIPQPSVSSKKNFTSEPSMNADVYNDILKIVFQTGKAMEKKPSLYQDKDEEALRDHFLAFLETRYDGTTATGETFNKGGKTDILLKYQDGTNLFVAECKFWHGASEFQKAINQLFDRYLTWRDSKTALLLFVSNADFSNVIKAIQEEALKHPYFLKTIGSRGDTSFSYEFHLPGDKGKNIYFEIIAFHFKKQ